MLVSFWPGGVQTCTVCTCWAGLSIPFWVQRSDCTAMWYLMVPAEFMGTSVLMYPCAQRVCVNVELAARSLQLCWSSAWALGLGSGLSCSVLPATVWGQCLRCHPRESVIVQNSTDPSQYMEAGLLRVLPLPQWFVILPKVFTMLIYCGLATGSIYRSKYGQHLCSSARGGRTTAAFSASWLLCLQSNNTTSLMNMQLFT